MSDPEAAAPLPRSLLRQAGWRLGLVLLVTLLIVGGSGIAFYFAAVQRSAARHADNLAGFYQDRLRQMESRWEREAVQFKAQLELSGALESPAGLTAGAASFLTLMGEESGFGNVHIDDGRDHLLFQHGSTLSEIPPTSRVESPPQWYMDSRTRILHRVFSLPVWLGSGRGMGHVHWYVPIDNGLLKELATLDSVIDAYWTGHAVASSAGRPPADDDLPTEEYARPEDGRLAIQRRVDWGDDHGVHPILVVRQHVPSPISTAELWLAVLATAAVMLGALALVLGPWLLGIGRRMALLGEASRQFSRSSHDLGPEVIGPLARARAVGDEIREVAGSLGQLMQGVVDRQRERDEQQAALEATRRRLTEAQEIAGLCHFEIELGPWQIVMNDQFLRVHRIPPDALAGHRMDVDEFRGRFFPPADSAQVARTIERCLADNDPAGTVEMEARFRCGDGTVRWMLGRLRVERDERGSPQRIVGTAEDIQERKAADAQRQLMATVFENSGEAILIADADNRIMTVNAAFTRLTGYAAEEVHGRNPRLLSAGRTTPDEYAAMWRSIGEQGFWRGEIWDRRKDGSVYPKWLAITAVRGPEGQVSNYIASFSDITEHKLAEEKIKHLAHHDALTGLPNRFSLQSRLAQAVAGAQRQGQLVAVMFIDLDRFKAINDTLGHHVGDEILIGVARRLQQCVRGADIVARLGGDEFVVALAQIHAAADAAHVAEKILKVLALPHAIEGHELHITPSIGISLYPEDGADEDVLMKNADIAMYHAKSLGRNNYQFFTPSMNQAAVEHLALESALRQALEREEFLLHFQPQIDVRSGQVSGAEALIRWRHPDAGLVPPDRFVPILEDTGLIVPVGGWVLGHACRELARWGSRGIAGLRMSVNLSARQFHERNLEDAVARALEVSGIPADRLELEITESVAMHDPRDTIATLRRLKDMGVLLAIDDFGTGYSSLSYLKLFPIDRLKLDRSFVADLESDANDAAICAATIGLAHNLGLEVVAEGVETAAQAEYLGRLGCDFIQGFLYCRPLPGDAAAEWIAGHGRPVAAGAASAAETHRVRPGAR